MKVRGDLLLFIFAVIFVGIPVSSFSAEPEDNADWRSTQDIWWNDGQLVKDVIVSTKKLLHDNPSLQFDTSFNAHLADVSALLLILDATSSKASLEALASLSSYKLNVAESEIYSCLIKRKGKKIEPSLRQMLASASSECINRFGAEAAKDDEKSIEICQKDDLYRTHLKVLLAGIGANTKCTFDK